jgi:flagellar L-ring protein FlgH
MIRIGLFLTLTAGLLLSAGCTAIPPKTRDPAESASIARQVPIERPATAGSLWTENRGSLFRDTKARQIGDLVTVAIYEQASASKQAATSSARNSSNAAGVTNFFGLESNLSGAIDPTKLVNTSYSNSFDGSGSTSRKEDLVATLTAQIVEELPNGTFRIEGGKTVTVNNEDQIIVLSGIVRPTDISAHNVVNSRHILDANISYRGKGVISDKQHPGWMTRILDHVWPF